MLLSMKPAFRLLMIVVLAAFAAGSLVHAAGSSEMAATMLHAGEAPVTSADCEACDEGRTGDMGSACDLVCATNIVAAIPVLQADGFVPLRRGTLVPAAARDLLGHVGPPAKQPPRTLI